MNIKTGSQYQLIEKALTFIDQNRSEQPNLDAVAEHCHLSPQHFQRIFSQWSGLSPLQFLHFLTRQEARKRLLAGDSVLDAAMSTGLSSSGRLHDLTLKFDAATPGEIRNGGHGLRIDYGFQPSPFGQCFVAYTKKGVCQLNFIAATGEQAHPLETLHALWPRATLSEQALESKTIIEQIFDNYASTCAEDADALRLWLRGSPFQLKVWEALINIPSGSVASYSQISRAIGNPGAARAVGSAVAQNPVALIIPCHRVIQSIGNLGGYRWGEIRKGAILGREFGLQESAAKTL